VVLTLFVLTNADGLKICLVPRNTFVDMRLDNPSKILLPSSLHPTPKHRTLDRHIDVIEWTHDSLDPVLIYFLEELLDCFLGLW
jgi:hypothetical protein